MYFYHYDITDQSSLTRLLSVCFNPDAVSPVRNIYNSDVQKHQTTKHNNKCYSLLGLKLYPVRYMT